MRNKATQERRLELSFLVGRFVTDHLTRVHEMFEGDLVAALVMATIAHRSVQRYYEEVARDSAEGLDKLVEAGHHVPHLRHCNAFSVSSATGIPRETVRRKVKWLEARGWISIGERGELSLPRNIGKRFEEFDTETIARFEHTARHALQVIDRAPSSRK